MENSFLCATLRIGFLLLITSSSCYADWVCGADCLDNDDCDQSVDCKYCSPLTGMCGETSYYSYYHPPAKNNTNPRDSTYAIAAYITSGFVVVVCCIVIIVVISWRRRQHSLSRRSSLFMQNSNRRTSSGFATAVATNMYGTTEPVAVTTVGLDASYNGVEVLPPATVAIPVASSAHQEVPVATAVY